MRRTLIALVVAVLAPAPGFAWNTDDSAGWASLYITTRPRQELPPAKFIGDEHSELAHLALASLRVAPCFGIAGGVDDGCSLRVVDLNASLFRPQVGLLPARGDDDETPLEERWLPPPAHFAGLPDFSWSVYDWINKNTLCAGLPGVGNLLGCDCHLFAGWFGLFNANHFGSQSRTMYRRYHRIALALAARARDLRQRIEQSTLPANAEALRDYAREAELEALVFEAVGQHFLQDRWSMGHMWERWGGADVPTTRPDFLDLGQAAMAGGLMHGHEGLSGVPDPMCSPVVGLFGAEPVQWRRESTAPEPGVGDYRLEDVYDGFLFDTDTPLAVPVQRARMIECSAAGWAEVIRAFGANRNGRLGAWDVELVGAPSFDVLGNEACWDQWATNAAISSGWFEASLITGIDVLLKGRLGLATAAAPVDCIPFRGGRPATDWAAGVARIALANHPILGDPQGTTLARGGLGPLGDAPSGDAYASYVPEYTEPENLDQLPVSAPQTGMDREAVYGFFNRAHSDYWCMGIDAELERLRGSTDPVKLAACEYLADRVYKGTDPTYQGARRESRQHTDRRESDPICAIHGLRTAGVVEALPYFLHPGYVETPYARDTYAYRSLGAWCRKLPVLDRTGPPQCPDGSQQAGASNDPDVVGRVGRNGGQVRLQGRNLGAAGEVWIGGQRLTVASWSDTAIVVQITADSIAAGLYPIQVRPAGTDESGWSVGNFLLDVIERFCPCPGSGVEVPPECEQPLGSWRLRVHLRPFHDEFSFAQDGSVVMCAQNCQLWQKIGTWSSTDRAVRIDPCPPNADRLVIAFEGEWSPRPEAEGFGVRSCGSRPCPALRGMMSRTTVGFPPAPFAVTSDGPEDFPGWRPFENAGQQTCHGGCWEYWRTHWPHQCAPYQVNPPRSFACGDQAAPECGGQCPPDFECREHDSYCRCLTKMPITCRAEDPPCPDGMRCEPGDLCVHY